MARKATHYEVTIVVESMRGYPFPLDMLRYDSCTFKDEGGARKAQDIIESPVHSTKGTRITLRRFVPAGGNPATEGRWESFGWRVLPRDEAEAHLGYAIPVFARWQM